MFQIVWEKAVIFRCSWVQGRKRRAIYFFIIIIIINIIISLFYYYYYYYYYFNLFSPVVHQLPVFLKRKWKMEILLRTDRILYRFYHSINADKSLFAIKRVTVDTTNWKVSPSILKHQLLYFISSHCIPFDKTTVVTFMSRDHIQFRNNFFF
jgi:hypothetical protein